MRREEKRILPAVPRTQYYVSKVFSKRVRIIITIRPQRTSINIFSSYRVYLHLNMSTIEKFQVNRTVFYDILLLNTTSVFHCGCFPLEDKCISIFLIKRFPAKSLYSVWQNNTNILSIANTAKYIVSEMRSLHNFILKVWQNYPNRSFLSIFKMYKLITR